MSSGSPFGYGYEPPAAVRGRPAVIAWFRVYAATMVLAYAGFLALWQFLTPNAPRYTAPVDTEYALIAVIVLVGLAVGGFFMVAALVPYKPWGWTVALIAICIGLSSCFAPAAVPLLVFWMKPETKAAFGRL